ncbi:Tumor necrosis factor ligand superfamily member 10 [Labeo rohita]|uniref:Tumor necrosis factor ligand superfamily member 10 n=1 Tax=Labeo rohita TaxID=84645 RepID=A0ABQ8LDW8_LABRO|nr:Tumor necrosis factor ligand superfamily member 10 [Labeo rohita]
MELRKAPIPLRCELTLGVVLKASINRNVREHREGILPQLLFRAAVTHAMVSMTSSHTMQYIGLLLLAAILLQTIAVAVTFIYFSNVLSTMKETFSKSSVSCLMRANLRTIKGQELNAAEGKDDPCWQVTQQLHFLIEKSMSSRYQKEISSAVKDEVSRVLPSLVIQDQDDSPRPKIAAHVTGSYIPEKDGGGQPNRKVYGQKIQSWESEKGLAFLQNVELSDGELVVPQAGLYYIYSQTYFRHTLIEEDESEREEEDGTSGESVRGKPMLQYVYKKVSSYPVPILLMKNARTTCWSRDTEYGLYSIYQAGLFQLGGGDRVFVTVSNISTIDMDEKSSFFEQLTLIDESLRKLKPTTSAWRGDGKRGACQDVLEASCLDTTRLSGQEKREGVSLSKTLTPAEELQAFSCVLLSFLHL